MKIGIDLDGVVIDSETTFRTYEEIFDIDFLKGNNLVNKEEPKFQARYNWTDKQEEEFIKKYFLTVSKESNLMSGFIGVYNLLKKQGHEFVVITARGGFLEEMKDDAIRLLDENNIKFDKYYWKIEDKLQVCQNENIDIIEKNIQLLNDLKFEDAEGIFEMYPDLFMNFPRKFEEKILRLKNQLGENYVEIIENDTSVLENII